MRTGKNLIIDPAKAKEPRLPLIPLFNRLVIKMPPEPKMPDTIGGIHLPPGADMTALQVSPYAIAEVLAAGPECKKVQKGDRILLNKMAVEGLIIGGNDYWITTEDRVYCIVDQPEKT